MRGDQINGDKRLLAAISEGDLSRAREALDRGADPNAIESGAHWRWSPPDPDAWWGWSQAKPRAAHIACQRQSEPMLDLLIERGADVELADGSGGPAWRWALMGGARVAARMVKAGLSPWKGQGIFAKTMLMRSLDESVWEAAADRAKREGFDWTFPEPKAGWPRQAGESWGWVIEALWMSNPAAVGALLQAGAPAPSQGQLSLWGRQLLIDWGKEASWNPSDQQRERARRNKEAFGRLRMEGLDPMRNVSLEPEGLMTRKELERQAEKIREWGDSEERLARREAKELAGMISTGGAEASRKPRRM